MIHSYSVALTQLVKEFNLRPIHKATDYEQINITVDDISRPGLQLAGYFDHFEPMRLQVIGTVETTYLNKLTPTSAAASLTGTSPTRSRR